MSTYVLPHGAPQLDGFFDDWGRKLRNTIDDIGAVIAGKRSASELLQQGVQALGQTYQDAQTYLEAYNAWRLSGGGGQPPVWGGSGQPPVDPALLYPTTSAPSGLDPNTLLLVGGGALALILYLRKK